MHLLRCMHACEVLFELVCECGSEIRQYPPPHMNSHINAHTANTALRVVIGRLLASCCRNIPRQVAPWQHAPPHPSVSYYLSPPSFNHLVRDTHRESGKNKGWGASVERVEDETPQRKTITISITNTFCRSWLPIHVIII